MKINHHFYAWLLALSLFVGSMGGGVPAAHALTLDEIDAGVDSALVELFASRPDMRRVYRSAEGVMVLPDVVKGGFIVGGSYGEGALVVNGTIDSYWSYFAGSVGLQAGAQRTRQVMFFMTRSALDDFLLSDGASVGADAELTIIDTGGDIHVDTNVAENPIIVVTFSRQGLLGGASVRGGQFMRLYNASTLF